MKKKWIIPFCAALVSLLSTIHTGFTATLPLHSGALQAKINTIDDEQQIELSLADLGFEESIEMGGAFTSVSAQFSLPYDWELADDARLNLRVTSAFQSLMEAFTTEDLDSKLFDRFGILRVMLNGKIISEIRITQNGETDLEILIPAEIFQRNAQSNTITLSWDVSVACQQSVTANIAIDTDSRISFSINNISITPSISYLPAPFYTPDAIMAEPVTAVLPQGPDADTLSALIAAAAGFGRQTNGEMRLQVVTADALPQSIRESHHLILFAKYADINSLFSELEETPVPALLKQEGPAEAGMLHILPSPWNSRRAMLVISGQDGPTLRKAAGTLASETLISSDAGNRVVVSEISDSSVEEQWQIDRSFADLFERDVITISTLGSSQVTLPFHVPADVSLSPESYIELYFRHSQLINYLQSSISVALNGNTIGTIRFGDQTATDGLARIILPPNAIQPLRNTLTLTFTMVPQDLCADERSGNYWISLFGDSYLHLPPVLNSSPLAERVVLNDLRTSFFEKSTFDDISFLISEGDPKALQAAVDIAVEMGALTTAQVMQPEAEFFKSDAILSNVDKTILIAESEAIADALSLNNALPLPFDQNGRITQINVNSVIFGMDAAQNFGILEVIPEGEDRGSVLIVSGNASAGLTNAVSELTRTMRQPYGEPSNVAVIDDGGEVHRFLVEKPQDLVPVQEQSQVGWQSLFFAGQSNRMAIVFLFAAVLITVIYIIWLVRRQKK